MTKLLKNKLKLSDCCIKYFSLHIIRKISAQTQILTEDAKTCLKLKTLVLCQLLQITHPFKISFLLSKRICSFIQAQLIAFPFPPN